MDFIILGLLVLSNRTIYQLRSRIDKGLNIMYSSSTGSIQAALRKLLSNGFIDFCEIEENGKKKKEYFITHKGRDEFNNWVNSPIDAVGFKYPDLTKIYFMGFTENENRTEIISKYIFELKNKYNSLKLICDESEEFIKSTQYEYLDKSAKDIIFYQLSTARYGRDMLEFTVKWYENFLEEMRNNNE